MVLAKLFKPTVGRIAIFIILFAAIALLDQAFLFFHVSPMTYNMFGPAGLYFVVFLLIIPYIISCIIPALYIREFRHAKLHEFVETRMKKPQYQKLSPGGVVDTLEDYEEIQEKHATSGKKSLQVKKKPKARKKSKTRRRR
jgi:hypothetical protein